MRIDVELLVPYKQIAETDHVRIDMEGRDMEDLISNLIGQIPALRHLLAREQEAGALPFFLMINGKIVNAGRLRDITINPGDKVTITQILSGG